MAFFFKKKCLKIVFYLEYKKLNLKKLRIYSKTELSFRINLRVFFYYVLLNNNY